MSLTTSRNSDVEVLRAFAIIFVVVHHLDALFLWGGVWRNIYAFTTFWGGVDLFFCVSGFVIATSLLRETQGDSFFDFVVPFWIKRVWRLWPAAALWLLISIATSAGFNASGAFGAFKANASDGVAALTQVANFHFLGCWSYSFGLCGDEVIYWSLSLEEQFYFLFPFLIFFLPRRYWSPVLVVGILLQCFRHRPVGSIWWMVRIDAICYGVLIALAAGNSLKEKLYPYFLHSKPAAFVFLSVFLFLLAAIPTNQVVWFDTGLLALVAAVLVFVASYDENFLLPVPYLQPLLMWIGTRSFAIYLTHDFSFRLTHEIFYRTYPHQRFDSHFVIPFAIVGFGLLVLFSEATYRWIETPLRNKGRVLARRYSERRQSREIRIANAPVSTLAPLIASAPTVVGKDF